MAHTCNPRTLEEEAGESEVPDQPGLHISKRKCFFKEGIPLNTKSI
jgi:hypothetical protein